MFSVSEYEGKDGLMMVWLCTNSVGLILPLNSSGNTQVLEIINLAFIVFRYYQGGTLKKWQRFKLIQVGWLQIILDILATMMHLLLHSI